MKRAIETVFVVLALLMDGSLILSQQTPNPANVSIVDVIPLDMSWETNQDSEPFLSVDPGDPSRMVISAFTPDPAGQGSRSAPVFVSFDSGKTWAHKSSVPIAQVTADITHSYAGKGILQAAALKLIRTPQGFVRPDMIELSANDPALTPLMRIQETRQNVDQPFVATVLGKDHDSVYIGENYLGGQADGTASVEVSPDNGAHFTKSLIESRSVSMQDGPSVRVAFARDAKAYVAYFGWRNFQRVDNLEGWITSDVVVARDDKGALGSKPFVDLKDDTDQLPGKIVEKSVKIHWSNKPTLGQERIGSTLSLAVDPNDSLNVYIAWADNMGPGDQYTIHVRRSSDAGKTWKDIKRIPSATCASLAVADNGTLGLLYHLFNANKWETHLEQTSDDFGPKSEDVLLANVSADLPLKFLPYLGDYNFLQPIGKEFKGVFSANNFPGGDDTFPRGVTYLRSVDRANHLLKDGNGNPVDPSIDPFYFSARVLDNPSKAWPSVSKVVSAGGSESRAHKIPQPTDRVFRTQLAMTPQGNAAESELKARLSAVDIVMLGHIVSVRDASQAFVSANGTLAAVPSGKTRISEHDPDLKEAVVQVDRVLKGIKSDQKTVVVRFPASLDIVWQDYPKLKEGQDGLFLLKKQRATSGGLQSLSDGTPLYSPPTKQDVLSPNQLTNVIKLLKQ